MLRLLLLLVCAATRPGSSTINITIGSLSGYNAPNIFNIVCIQAAIDDAQKAGWTTDINIKYVFNINYQIVGILLFSLTFSWRFCSS